MVLAYDEATGEIVAKPVTDLIRPEPRQTYALVLRGPDGADQTFTVTDDHPWLTEDRGWIETLGLQEGERIDTADDDWLTVVSLESTGRAEQTYNLTVADLHTFLVGEDQAIVHNAGPCNKMTKAASPVWKRLRSWRGKTKTDGKNRFEWDYENGNIEVYNKNGRHLGVVDPVTCKIVPNSRASGRKIMK